MRISFVALLAVGALEAFVPLAARADRRDLYTVLAIEPAWTVSRDPLSGEGQATAPMASVALSAYYGITNSIHLGAVARFGYSRDVTYEGVTVTLPDGTSSQGRLFHNSSQFGLSALGLYRFDTGIKWAPFASIEAGLVHDARTAREHVPAGASFGIAFPDRAEMVPVLRPAIGLEYRVTDRFIIAMSTTVGVSLDGGSRVQLAFPVAVGATW